MESDLGQLAQEIRVCQKCPLAKTRSKAVPGEGNPRAAIVFVGEGPGLNEDKQGRPFVGVAGKLLDDLLASINLSRQDVFITNVVKCRPKDNRDPEEKEISTCTKTYLEPQIELIDPKIIVCLGRYALQKFLGKNASISSLHGRAFRKEKRAIMAFYHPAVALYRATLRQTLFDDFKKLKILLKKLTPDS